MDESMKTSVLADDQPRHPAGTNEGGQFAPVGGLGARTANAFRSMPEVDSATSREAAGWRKQHQELYNSDPEFKAACDAVGLYTQGSYDPLRDAAHLHATGEGREGRPFRPDDFQKPLGRASNPMATYTNYFDGQNVGDSKACTVGESGGVLHGLVATAQPTDKPLFRGMRAGYGFDSQTMTTKMSVEIPKAGDEFDLAATSSFSASRETAESFALYHSGRKSARNAPDHTAVAVVYEIAPGAKAANVSALSPWKGQREFITAGKFEVESVEEREHEVYSGDRHTRVKGYHIRVRQKAVLDKPVNVTPQAGRITRVPRLAPEPKWIGQTFDEQHSDDLEHV